MYEYKQRWLRTYVYVCAFLCCLANQIQFIILFSFSPVYTTVRSYSHTSSSPLSRYECLTEIFQYSEHYLCTLLCKVRSHTCALHIDFHSKEVEMATWMYCSVGNSPPPPPPPAAATVLKYLTIKENRTAKDCSFSLPHSLSVTMYVDLRTMKFSQRSSSLPLIFSLTDSVLILAGGSKIQQPLLPAAMTIERSYMYICCVLCLVVRVTWEWSALTGGGRSWTLSVPFLT